MREADVSSVIYMPFGLSLSFDKIRMIGGTPFGLSLSKPVFGAVLRQAQDKRPVSNGGPR